jgi:hypothetical protein
LSFVSGFHRTPATPTTISLAPILNDAFSKPHICDCLYCAFPRNHLGAIWETGGGEVSRLEATKAFRALGIFLLISVSNTPFRRHLHFNRFKNQNIFPQIAAAVLMLARAQHVPMKRKNLSKTLKVAKKSISSHKLFIIIVTSTIHYATENNCKEISQDRMHHHHVWKTAKLNDLSNCLFFILQAKMRSTM